MALSESIRRWAHRVKRDAVMLWFAWRHPDAPLLARALAALVVAYALSPIDLIPDFVPVLGYVDDVVVLPVLIWLAVRALPPHVVAASREAAERWMRERGAKPRSTIGALLVIALWVAAAIAAWRWMTVS